MNISGLYVDERDFLPRLIAELSDSPALSMLLAQMLDQMRAVARRHLFAWASHSVGDSEGEVLHCKAAFKRAQYVDEVRVIISQAMVARGHGPIGAIIPLPGVMPTDMWLGTELRPGPLRDTDN